MREARIICIGKMKSDCFKAACAHYEKLLLRMRPVRITELKDGSAALEPARRSLQEGERIRGALEARDWPVCLDQTGIPLSSPEFAAFLKKCDETVIKRPAFIIGGPFGLAPEVLRECGARLSLSTMTLPHELARVVLLEQIYRAECILRGHPYHH